MKTPITYLLSQSTDKGFAYQLTIQRQGKDAELMNRWPNDAHIDEAIGFATKKAIQSKHDYGNHVNLVIDLPICSIDAPMITI